MNNHKVEIYQSDDFTKLKNSINAFIAQGDLKSVSVSITSVGAKEYDEQIYTACITYSW
ncbi:MAG: hypothetical protein IPP77_03680 [Bacteroidetes bacterium]|nr:hypothetical protein [Bacteroidota bacterium]